jgi:hypothetical protein
MSGQMTTLAQLLQEMWPGITESQIRVIFGATAKILRGEARELNDEAQALACRLTRRNEVRSGLN